MSGAVLHAAPSPAIADRPPVCADLDDDCAEVPDKVHCWLYDPAKGRCPFLSAEDPE